MTARRLLAFLLTALLVLPLTGCLGGGAKEVNTLTLVDAPTEGKVGDSLRITYRIDGPEGTARWNVLKWGYSSNPRDIGVKEEDYPNTVFEPGKQEKAPVPGTFTVELPLLREGKVYYRVHTVIGTQDLWSPEITVNVTAS